MKNAPKGDKLFMFRFKTSEMNTVSAASAPCAEAHSVRSCTENTAFVVILGAMLVASIFVSLALRLFLLPAMIIMLVIILFMSGEKTRERY